MFRPTTHRAALRALRTPNVTSRRTLFTKPAEKQSSWKGRAARWGAAGGVIWYFAGSNVFADEGEFSKRRPAPNMSETDPRPPSQLDSYVQKAKAPEPVLTPTTPTPTPATPSTAVEASPEAEPETAVDGAAELEEEAGQQGAFNPETGEINWDCPCLGGMAHGPCGEQFKAAFSCFIFSEAEPKGADCIEHFKKMQECFQEHPEIYGDDLTPPPEDEEAFDEEVERELQKEKEALREVKEEAEREAREIGKVVKEETGKVVEAVMEKTEEVKEKVVETVKEVVEEPKNRV